VETEPVLFSVQLAPVVVAVVEVTQRLVVLITDETVGLAVELRLMLLWLAQVARECLGKGLPVELTLLHLRIQAVVVAVLLLLAQPLQGLSRALVGQEQIGNLSGRSTLAAAAAAGHKRAQQEVLLEVAVLATAATTYLPVLRLRLIPEVVVEVVETLTWAQIHTAGMVDLGS
jgi:hypothetical protein